MKPVKIKFVNRFNLLIESVESNWKWNLNSNSYTVYIQSTKDSKMKSVQVENENGSVLIETC